MELFTCVAAHNFQAILLRYVSLENLISFSVPSSREIDFEKRGRKYLDWLPQFITCSSINVGKRNYE
jgi:hypothetical protein